jgi:hypothetical protein
LYQFTKYDDETDCSNYGSISLSTSYTMVSNIMFSVYVTLLGIVSVDFEAANQLWVFCIPQTFEKINGARVRKEELYNTVIWYTHETTYDCNVFK